jgi:hypothetical protein
MDMLLRKIIKDTKAGEATEASFVADAKQYLTPEVFAELTGAFATGGVDQVMSVMKKYGKPSLVDAAYRVTVDASKAEKDEPENDAEADEKQPQVKGQPDASIQGTSA